MIFAFLLYNLDLDDELGDGLEVEMSRHRMTWRLPPVDGSGKCRCWCWRRDDSAHFRWRFKLEDNEMSMLTSRCPGCRDDSALLSMMMLTWHLLFYDTSNLLDTSRVFCTNIMSLCHFLKSLDWQFFWCQNGDMNTTRRLVPLLARSAHRYLQGKF